MGPNEHSQTGSGPLPGPSRHSSEAAGTPQKPLPASASRSGWVERALAGTSADAGQLLRDIFAASSANTLRALPGRTTFVWPAEPAVIVKRFGSGVLRDLLHDLVHARGARSCARREAENLRELGELGMPVPRALGWCEERGGWSGRSAMWMQRVEHSSTLRQLAERDPAAALERRSELARLVARLHVAGWFHRDLYLEHWIVAAGRLVLLDVGRARREESPRERWLVKDVAALLHSCPAGIGTFGRLKFLALYLDARGVQDRGQRHAFARAVVAKARRIAAHEPRHVDRTSRT